MGLMNTMRNRMHVILWILLILFIGSMTVGGLVGGADIINQIFGRVDVSRAIAVVNGETIPPDLFFHQLDHRLEQARSQGAEVDSRNLDFERERIFNELIEATIINQEIKKRKISVTAEEIYFELINNPPATLKTIPDFQTDGVFNQTKYLAALRNPQGDEWRPIEDYVRQYLPRQKLFNELRSGVYVSLNDIKNEYIIQNLEHTISALIIRASKFTDSTFEPTKDEMENYYFLNPNEFEQTEQRILDYVEWAKSPSKDDSLISKQTAEDILNQLSKGSDFAQLANEYSEDPGNRDPDGKGRGGDLGWFGSGQMVEPFEKAAFSGKKGHIVGPVLTDFGFHIIQIKDIRTDKENQKEVHASHILIKIDMGPSTRNHIRGQANQFLFDVEDFGFDEALVKNNNTFKSMRPITENSSFIPSFGYFTEPAKFGFNNKIGAHSEIIESDQSFVIFRLDSIIASGTKEYESVSNQIRNKLRNSKRIVAAKAISDKLMEGISDGNLKEIAESNENVEFVGPVSSNLSNPFNKIGKHESVVGALLAAEVGQILPPIETSQTYVIIKLESREEFDQVDWEVKKDLLKKNLSNQRENEFIRNWIKRMKDESEIVDNRNFFF
tara:strand:+ start:3507 stop:5342 length:1836 start_codon:yes stop_codon:yes gene_type:complete